LSFDEERLGVVRHHRDTLASHYYLGQSLLYAYMVVVALR
jgi:hypothetical protein